jgi:hypothetical protein
MSISSADVKVARGLGKAPGNRHEGFSCLLCLISDEGRPFKSLPGFGDHIVLQKPLEITDETIGNRFLKGSVHGLNRIAFVHRHGN